MREMWIIFTQNNLLQKIMFKTRFGWTEDVTYAKKFYTYKRASKFLSSLYLEESSNWTRGDRPTPKESL